MSKASYRNSSSYLPETIHLSLEVMTQVLEQVAQPIAVTDREGIIWYANQAMGQLLDIPIANLVGASIADFLPSGEMLRWLLPCVIAKGWTGELRLSSQGQSSLQGQSSSTVQGLASPILPASSMLSPQPQAAEVTIPTQVSIRPLHLRDYQSGLLTWSFSDLTQQKQLEAQWQAENQELRRSSRLKSEFLANMSHELRTPLTSILGFSSILKQQIFGALTPKQDTYTQRIYRSGEHLLALINDILDLSKIEAGQLVLDRLPLSVSQVCLEAISLVSEQAHNRKLTIHTVLPEDLPALSADEIRLRQMLLNLLSNAIKFSDEGGEIGLEAQVQEAYLWITVWDQGVGIPSEKQHLMFQPFKQLDDNATRRHLGTGLGLALTKRLVELHDGTIQFESQLGQGSRFMLCFPLATASANQAIVDVQK
ncbi:MAG: ATP-binding protein [Synechococcales bacterium]|nr:ATP-binding protein [Synechococcales bacterium]